MKMHDECKIKNAFSKFCGSYVANDKEKCVIMVGNPKVKVSLGRSRIRWNYNIKIDLQVIGWESID
jgi:hypothetical protein